MAFVKASFRRSSVVSTLRDWPKTTGQVAIACALSPAHASRAIRELVGRDLVTCLTPQLRGRGKLYGLTQAGKDLSDVLDSEDRHSLTIPLVRGTQPRAWFRVLTRKFGLRKGREPFVDAGLIKVVEGPIMQWIPLRAQLRLLEAVERQFGDGSYNIVRKLAAEAVADYDSVRRYLIRALPLRVIIDLAPAAYLREFNHGRMEVEVRDGMALFKQYDWLSSPARCAAWLGTYEGSFSIKNVVARVHKAECLLRGDEFCGYIAEWNE